MNIDERLDRLTERHEALAQSLEVLRATVHEVWDALDDMRAHSQRMQAQIEQTQAQVQVLVDVGLRQAGQMQTLTGTVQELAVVTRSNTDAISELVRIASAHEQRLGRLESRPS